VLINLKFFATGNINNNKQSKSTGNNNNGSSTEDESGFSSISSFHDVGLPLSSTLIGDNNNNNRRLSLSTESRNSTLKSAVNVVGVPLRGKIEIRLNFPKLKLNKKI